MITRSGLHLRQRLHRHGGTLYRKIPPMAIGIVIGFVVAMNFVLWLPPQQDQPSDVHSLRGGGGSKSSGWKTLHVFYGPSSASSGPVKSSYAQVGQDIAVASLVGSSNNNNNNNGYFIDLAANDATEFSNTRRLEQLGWKGLCIEPNPVYWYGLASQRTCTLVAAMIGGDVPEQVSVKFRGVYGGMVGRINERLADFKKEPDSVVEQRYTAPFRHVLELYHVPKVIDYLSLDVEGAEYLIMQHFPFDQYRIRILTIERPDDQMKALLQQHGYVHLKDLAWWGETIWAHQSEGLSPTSPKVVAIPTEERSR